MMVGGAVDEAVNANMFAKIKTGEYLPWEQVEEKARMVYDRRIKEALEGDGILFKEKELIEGRQVTIDAGLAKVLRMSKLHFGVVAPKLNPLHVQRSIYVPLDGWPFDIGGVIDLQEVDLTIRDTKVKDKAPGADFAYEDDQLTNYGMLEYLISGNLVKLVYDCRIATKVVKYHPAETTRTPEDFEVMLTRIANACDGISKGVFYPAKESDWWCGKYACGYWGSCKYVKRSRYSIAA